MIFGLNFTFLSKYWFYYMDGLKVTLQLAFWTLILSSIVGVIMGMIRVQNYKIISTIIDWWINFIRGVPIMVQISLHGNQRMNLIKAVVCVWRTEMKILQTGAMASSLILRQKAYGIRCSLTQQQNWMQRLWKTLLHSNFVIQFFYFAQLFFHIAVVRDLFRAAAFLNPFNASCKQKINMLL